MSIVVNTPGGNIGRELTTLLLADKQKVTIITRNPEKVADLVKKGAKLVKGSIDDTKTLDEALKGANALYWLTPPISRPDHSKWAAQTAKLAAEAVKKHKIDRVVVQSSVGAQNGPGAGPVGALLAVEKAFEGACKNVTHLRAGFFMENLFHNLSTIASDGVMYATFPENVAIPMVATRDIAAKAKVLLTDTKWKGHQCLGVHGPKDLSYADIAAELTKTLGKKVRYMEISIDQAKKAMLQMGMPDFAATAMCELYKASREGKLNAAEPRTKDTTTTTTLKMWAEKVMKPALKKAEAAA